MNLLFLLPPLPSLLPPHPPSLPPLPKYISSGCWRLVWGHHHLYNPLFLILSLFPLSHRHLRLHTIQRLLPQIRFPLDVGGDVFGDIGNDPSQAVAREEDNVFKHDHEHDSGQHHLVPNRSRLVGGGRVRSVVAVVTHVVANELRKMRVIKRLDIRWSLWVNRSWDR